MKKKSRDVEKTYSTPEFVAKLRRLADALETGQLHHHGSGRANIGTFRCRC